MNDQLAPAGAARSHRHRPRKAKPAPAEGGPPPETEFCYHAPNARQVFLAGSFNDWNPESLLMQRDAEGNWRLRLPLAPGHHEYRFIADGVWSDDPHACAYKPNPWGWCNCVVEVSPTASSGQ